MAKRKRRTRPASRTNPSNSSGEAFLGLLLICLIIGGIAIAISLGIVLLPLILIPMWLICKEWSKGIKIFISTLIIIIWALLLPFSLGFLGEIISEHREDNIEEYSSNNALSTVTPSVTTTPSPTPIPVTLPTLSKGMTGEDIITLQNRLKELRYLDGEVDGQFSSQTEQAVRSFQAKNSIVENGIADINTLTQLFSDTALGYYSGDLEWLTRDNTPQYYGNTAQAHAIWDDVSKGKIIFADTYDKYESGHTVLYMNDYSSDKNAPISDIEVYFMNCNPPVRIKIDEAVKIASRFFPYEVTRKWHEHGRSYFQPAENNNGNSYYICYYHLSEKGKTAHDNKQHSYPGAFCIVFVVNPDGFIDYFHYTWGVPDSIGSPTSVDWDFDFLKAV